MIYDFIKYAKAEFGIDIELKLDETPDTFEGVFGVSFLGFGG